MTILTSLSGNCTFGTGYPTILVSMLINTLKDENLARSLIRGDFDIVRRLAEKQCHDGTGILQIMVAHPEIDEEVILPKVCKAAHDASGLPLYIDSTNITAIKRTLEKYPYKPILSLSANVDRLQPMLNLVKGSGTAVICLCMDDQGIPSTFEGRLAIGERIIQQAREIGIPDDDIVMDPLVMAAGVSEPNSLSISLELLRFFKKKFSFSTFLGIDNAGFGMPLKSTIDLAYLLAAIPAGLDAALLDPLLYPCVGRQNLNLLFAANFISGRDPYAIKYLAYLRKNKLIKSRKHE